MDVMTCHTRHHGRCDTSHANDSLAYQHSQGAQTGVPQHDGRGHVWPDVRAGHLFRYATGSVLTSIYTRYVSWAPAPAPGNTVP